MVIIGLTGSIGMGKSAAASHFIKRGIAVFDADQAVHRLYEGAAVPLIEEAFPGATANGRVDRQKLGQAVIGRSEALRRLEAIIHPLVREAEWRFLREQQAARAAMAVLEIPLLFETGSDRLVDAAIVVSAPEAVQRARVLQRPGMTPEKLAGLLAQQMPDRDKRARADFVVDTGGALGDTHRQIDIIIESLRQRIGTALRRWRAMDHGSP